MGAKKKAAERPQAWVSLAVAASHLGTSPDALAKVFARNARAVEGGVEAKLDGVRARKLGRLWRVQFSAAWLSDGDAA